MSNEDIKRIQTESRDGRIDRVRNKHRLWLEVASHSQNGSTVGPHAVSGPEFTQLSEDAERLPWQTHSAKLVPTRVEIYEDHLRDVLAKTRTPEDKAVLEAATDQAVSLTKDWIREHQREYDACGSEFDKAKMVYFRCQRRPEHELVRFGRRTGMPPLEYCWLIHPDDPERTIDARDYAELDDATFRKKHKSDKASWRVAPPESPMSLVEAQIKGNQALADAILQVVKGHTNDKG